MPPDLDALFAKLEPPTVPEPPLVATARRLLGAAETPASRDDMGAALIRQATDEADIRAILALKMELDASEQQAAEHTVAEQIAAAMGQPADKPSGLQVVDGALHLDGYALEADEAARELRSLAKADHEAANELLGALGDELHDSVAQVLAAEEA